MYSDITPQIAQAELNRRAGIQNQDITPEMARAELARRGIDINQPMTQPQQGGLSSIPGDALNLGMRLVSGLGDKAMQLPNEIGAGINQLATKKDLPRTIRNIAAGALESGKQTWNLPFELGSYLDKKAGLNSLAALADAYKIGDTGLQNAVLGAPQKGDQLFQDIGSLATMYGGPKSLGVELPALRANSILKEMSLSKQAKLAKAKNDFGALFNDANKQGVTHAFPPQSVLDNKDLIIENAQNPQWTEAFENYIKNPTIENAHWAQSDLGGMVRNLRGIRDNAKFTGGLSSPQKLALKAAQDAQQSIKKEMFSENSLGKNPLLAMRYDMLRNDYKTNVLPYTRLKPLSDYENGQLTPATAMKKLLTNENFKMNLMNKHPGAYLHTPTANKVKWGAAGVAGLDEINKLINER